MVLLPISVLGDRPGLAMFGFVIRSLDSGLENAQRFEIKDLKVAGDYVMADSAVGSGVHAWGLFHIVHLSVTKWNTCDTFADTWLRMPPAVVRGHRTHNARLGYGQSLRFSMKPLTKAEQESEEFQRGWYPDDTPAEFREFLKCYSPKWMSFDEHTTSFCPPLRVVPVPLNAKLTKEYGASGFQLTEDGKRMLAFCQPHRARLFGLDIREYLHPAQGIFGGVFSKLKKSRKADHEDQMDLDDEKEQATEEMDIDELQNSLGRDKFERFCSNFPGGFPVESYLGSICRNIKNVEKFVVMQYLHQYLESFVNIRSFEIDFKGRLRRMKKKSHNLKQYLFV